MKPQTLSSRVLAFRRTLPGLLGAALALGASPSEALVRLKDISRKEAGELGITVCHLPAANGKDVRVQIDFKTTGALKNFTGADLTVTHDGKQLVSAPLQGRKPTQEATPERVRLEFYLDPAAVPGTVVTITAYNEPLTGIGYRLKVADYAEHRPSR